MQNTDSEQINVLLKEAADRLQEALTLCSLYETSLVQDWNDMQNAIAIIEDCEERTDEGEFLYADYLACFQQEQQCKLELLLGLGAILDKDVNGESIVLNDDGVLVKI